MAKVRLQKSAAFVKTTASQGGQPSEVGGQRSVVSGQTPSVALLTGGEDRPYALGIAEALRTEGMDLDFIGSDDLISPKLLQDPGINFLNLRGDQNPEANIVTKTIRIFRYYIRLIRYAARAEPRIFHILWNNRLQFFDRTMLMQYYKWLGKKVVLTVHNVNTAKRDLNDSFLNRFSLRIQYHLSDHIFVHTTKMKEELVSDFAVDETKTSVIPFGINNTVSNRGLTAAEARQILGIAKSDKALLFFGKIAPYKGIERLITALAELLAQDRSYRLIIAGKPEKQEDYWNEVEDMIALSGAADRIVRRIEYVPDEETEVYFKAANVVVLPYTQVFQSGVLFLAYAFGLPVIAADVGSLKEEVIEGETGFVFNPQEPSDLADKINRYFRSELCRDLESRRAQIKGYANERYSWSKVATITTAVYSRLLTSDL